MSRTPRAAIRTVIAVPTFFVFTLVLASVVALISLVRRDAPVIERIIGWWSRLFLTVAPVSLETSGQERIDPEKQYVFVANHLSNFDIPVVLLAIPVPIRFLAKKELFKIPLLAQAMRSIGIIETDRQAHAEAHALINTGVRTAKERGHSLIIFPEGTRSRTGEFGAFKKGAFRIAISNGLPVVPVSITGTWEVWQPDAKVFYPGSATATIHEPIPTEGLALSDITVLRDRTHAVIAAALGEPAPAG